MLNVGIDSYITVAEADAYIAANYAEYDDLAVVWGVLSEHDKEAYLRASLGQIEALVLYGRPYSREQALQFPRRDCFKAGPDIPSEVKEAQAENALALLNKDLKARSDEQMKTLGTLGVVKNTKYNKREMGEVGLGATLTGLEKHSSVLESEDAVKMLKAWY